MSINPSEVEILRGLVMDLRSRLSEIDELTTGKTYLDRVGSTHWADCYKDHHDCLVVRIRAALDGES